ncbi:MAG: ABC transporter substrate-binding protein [Flavipsychrobacter sp.]|nr:ABC transporter substrate-binding protein [Flavipsychrobacter sp.]
MWLRGINKLIAIVLPAWLLLASTGCSQPQTTAKKVFRLNYASGSLESIDPAFAKDLYVMWTVHMIYNTLVEADEHQHIVPSLAKSWAVSPDGLSYTFNLRNDVYFQDNPLFPGGKGRRMTAADVAYSLGRLIDPAIASTGGWIFNGKVDERQPFTAVNDTTVQIKLVHPFRPLVQMLSMPYCSIVPKEVAVHWGRDFRRHPCGTGPFMYHYWDEGNVLVLHKNPNYWEMDGGHRLPNVDAVQVTFTDSKATEFFLFMQGKLDFVNGIDGTFKDLILSRNGTIKKEYANKFRLDKGVYYDTEYIGFLMDSTAPGMKLVRQAINYAVDRKKIVTYFRNGCGIPACGGFIPYGMPGYDSTEDYGYHYDPAKVQQLLAQAGYPHGKGLPVLKITTVDNWVDITNLVATQLQEAGIPTQIDVLQPNILKQQTAVGQVACFRATWLADYPDAESYMAFFYSHYPAPPNYTRFKNQQFDKWYEQSLNAPDSTRLLLYRSMDSLAMSYAPVLPLFYDQLLHFTQNNVHGFASNAMNIIDLKKVELR